MPPWPSMPDPAGKLKRDLDGLPILSTRQQESLLRLARLAIRSHWHPELICDLQQAQAELPLAQEPVACFVTLHKRGELRGCIGCLEPEKPLADALVYFAQAAAFGDPRFVALSEAELDECQLSISLLGPLQPIPTQTRAQVLQALLPEADGLWLQSPGHRATFLPAVWRELPDPEEFLDHLLHKGGWSLTGWPQEMQGFRYRSLEIAENGTK